MPLQQRVLTFWYAKPSINLLKPLSWFMGWFVQIRKIILQAIAPTLPLPVVVVGNITLGGTGKTPVLIALTKYLTESGHQVGIISRGYHSSVQQTPYLVKAHDSATLAGDEPLMISQQTGRPVMIGKNRVESIQQLKKQFPDLTVILSDDGLQHYRMKRNVEIVMVDGQRLLGNENLLPFGPLREPSSRLKSADYVLSTRSFLPCVQTYARELDPVVRSLHNNQKRKLADFIGEKVHVVTGIGNPEQLFQMLKTAGLNIVPHIFPDHHQFLINDVQFHDDFPVLMTEKDAMKCQDFNLDNTWVISLNISIPSAVLEGIKRSL